MPTTNPIAQDDTYQRASKQLGAAIDAYNQNPSVDNLIAVYEAQNAVRAAADSAGKQLIASKPVDAKTVDTTLALLRDPSTEAVPGAHLGMAQALLEKLRAQQASGTVTMQDAQRLGDAARALEDYINQSTARIQDNDTQFADDYMRITGQPPPPGRFSSGQTINGTAPTPQPSPGQAAPSGKTVMAVKHFTPSGYISPVPDEGVRPPGVNPPTPPAAKVPKPVNPVYGDEFVDVNPLPSYTPTEWQYEYRQEGLNTSASDSIKNAADAIRRSTHGLVQAGTYGPGGLMNENALKTGNLVFVGYNTGRTQQKIVGEPEEYLKYGPQYSTYRTPAYENKQALKYGLGQEGFPSIAEFQKAMGLPVTGTPDDATRKYWDYVVEETAAYSAYGFHMTVQDVMQDINKRKRMAAASARAAMAAAYNVDPTASAAILGSAMKQITGRLSTAAEDAEFHRAFNSANISTQGKVDAQQFARDWVRNKYPTEAGTMAGQDYYGAMYDVLTAGPGSLGSQAADING